ncbi:MFS transporter small subunit [Tunturiibacter psychrotolerans]|uniref:MFS transporter small subunit n=1 Tax=Tunturiibacter psychrotolerans TaxID=3069686 RepID=UPI003DA7A2C7
MIKEIGTPMLSKRAVSGTEEKSSSLLQANRTSRLKLLLAWSIVVLPLAWGLYATERTTAPLIHTLLSHSH